MAEALLDMEPKPYCVTVRDVYGSDFAHLTPPAGYEWGTVDGRAEFRIPLDFDKWLTKQCCLSVNGGSNSTAGQPRLILRERKRRRIVFTETRRSVPNGLVRKGEIIERENGMLVVQFDFMAEIGEPIYSRSEEEF